MALALLALAAAAAASHAHAAFADAAGFSGRVGGQTCVACHAPPSPTHDDAAAELAGLPAAWDPGATYALKVAVRGGPPAMPAPAPQGGFDLAVSGGSLAAPPAMAGLVRLVGAQEATYLPDGTLRRDWELSWTAPTLAEEPAPVTVWLAVLSANGNHVVATNASDLGETLDAAASTVLVVPPSAAALEAWRALPLRAPEAAVVDGRVEGRHTDTNATALAYAIDGGSWTVQPTSAQWALRLGLGPGKHVVALRSEGAGRSSPTVELALEVTAAGTQQVDAPDDASAPAPAALLVTIALLAAAQARRPPRRDHL